MNTHYTLPALLVALLASGSAVADPSKTDVDLENGVQTVISVTGKSAAKADLGNATNGGQAKAQVGTFTQTAVAVTKGSTELTASMANADGGGKSNLKVENAIQTGVAVQGKVRASLEMANASDGGESNVRVKNLVQTAVAVKGKSDASFRIGNAR